MEKIIVVEDELDVRENLVDLLEGEGYDVKSFPNPVNALEELKNGVPDLILSDITMPYIDGYQFYTKVRNELFMLNVPFLFLTARTDEQAFNYAMELGADDYIKKPYTSDELLKRIKRRLEKKNAIQTKFENLKMGISLYVPHELRTPLIPILGLTEMLTENYSDFNEDEIKEMIFSVHKAGLRLYDRLEKFNTFSELKLFIDEAQDIEVDEPIDTSSYNNKVQFKKNYETASRLEDIQLNFDDAKLMITQNDLGIIINELLSNASKFSEPDTKITATGKIIDQKYVLSVSNIGESINANLLESFSQQDRNYNQQQGNGLGLAIIKMLANKYNLEFEIRNEPLTTVTVKFPLN